MNKIVVKHVTMSGFKNHKEEVDYNFEMFTTVNGDNSKGKTTIADAIAWCLTGSNYMGKEKMNVELTNNLSKIIKVSLIVDLINDEITETKNITRISGGGKTCDGFFIDGEKVKPQHILDNLLNIDKYVFFSMLNPLYFSSLDKTEAKATILKVVRKIEDDEVLSNLEEYQRNMLINAGYKNNINLFAVQLKDKIKSMKENSIYFQGAIDAKNEKIILPEMNIESIKKEREVLFSQIADEEKNIKNEYTKEYKNQKVKEDKLQNLNNLNQRLAVLLAKSSKSEIVTLQNELKYYNNYPLPQKPQLQNVDMVNKQIVALRSKYTSTKNKIDIAADSKISCNKCGNEIHIESAERKILNQLVEEITKEGTTLKDNLTKLTEINTKLNENYTKDLKEAKNSISKELKIRQDKINVLNNKGESPEITKLKGEVQMAQKELESTDLDLSNEKVERANDIRILEVNLNKKLNKKEESDKETANYNNLYMLEKNRKKDLEKSINSLEKNKNDLIDNASILTTVKEFIALKIKLQEQVFKKYLDKVDISLEKVLKTTGELKDDFSISYEGKALSTVSDSEKIKAGLELVKMFSNLKGIYLPTILDNAESITRYNTIKYCQTIETRVKKDSELALVS